MQNRYFIRDCNGKIVGNVKGYATIKGATTQQNKRGSKAYNAIWKAYDENKKLDQNWFFVSSVSCVELV